MLFLFAFLITQSAQACPDVSSCKSLALAAYAQKDYERFHDLAWLAHRKAGKDDPDLLIMLARAQSLSGRPGDALVMLERRAKLGWGPPELVTDPDFEAARRLPRWDDVRAKLMIGVVGSELSALPEARPKPVPATPPATPPTSDPPPPPKTASRMAGGPLSFTTLLNPTALAYDAVSKRYLIADRQAKRIAVVDESTGQVSTLAGAQARLGEIRGMAIDPRQGDLWVVTSAEEGASLHRLQLISGRELGAARITGLRAPVVGMAFVRGVGLVIADEQGDILRLQPGGRAEKIGSLEYVPRALAADGEGTLYIAAGGPRLARFAVGPPLKRVGLTDLPDGMGSEAPFTVVSREIRFIAPAGGAFEIRR